MWIVVLAWKNLWRNRNRTLITISSIFFAVILSTTAESLKLGVFDNLVKNVVAFYTGYIQVHKKGYQDEQILDNGFMLHPNIKRAIYTNSKVSGVSPRLELFALASSEAQTRGCMIVGIEAEAEDRLTHLRKKLVGGQYLGTEDRSVLLSAGLSSRLKLGPGDTIVLIGQGYHGATAAGKYLVKGIVRFGSPQLNEKVLYMPLAATQEFVGAQGLITACVISIYNKNNLNKTAAMLRTALGNDYEVVTWEDLLPEIKQHIATDSSNMKVVQGILYLLICFGIFSTMLMMMLERRYEMGMLVAIGMSKAKLMMLLITESVFTVLVGCLAGIAASIPLVLYLKKYPIHIGGDTAKAYERFGFEAIFPASSDSAIFIYQAATVLIIGLALSLYPVIKIIQLNPVLAMRK